MATWIATIGALDGAGASDTLRFSDGAYIDSANNYFEPRMTQPALIKVSPSDGGTFHCFSSPSIGIIELINIDGGLNYLADYALDNGDCILSLIDDNGQKTDYLTGKIESMSDSGDKVNLIIRSMSEVLGRNHTNTKYAGDNVLPAGVEGVATDIKGNMKPKVYGIVKNATPICVNTSNSPIYQFSDRQTCVVSAIYDRGGVITLGTTYTWANFATFQTTAPTAGTFNRCAGYVKIGTAPGGTVTGDCNDNTTTLAGDVFESILAELTVPIAFDTTSKTLLNTVGAVGLYITSETSTASLLDQIIKSCGAYWYFMGSIVYANLVQLAVTSVLDITDSERITIDRTATGLGSNGIPFATCLLKYNKIETVQQETDLVGSITAARKAELSKEYRSAFIFDAPTIARHPLAESMTIDSCLLVEADATAVATRLLTMAKVRVDVINITAVVAEIPALTLGVGINVISNKLGYNQGKLFTLIGFQIDAKKKLIVLECIG